MNVKLRTVKKEDVDILYEWANDPVTRKNSFSEEPINYQTHVKWFNSCMDNPNCIQLILEVDESRVGQARLDINAEETKLSYSIAPSCRLMGYGKILISEVARWINDYIPNIKVILADTKPDNIASQEVLRKSGFVERHGHFELYVDEVGLSINDNKNANNKNRNYEKIVEGGVLFLTNNNNALELYDWINERIPTILYSDRIVVNQLDGIKPKIIISYNYSYIINNDVIEYMKGNIINMHISLLPYNKGASPNVWSFIDNTPKGVTIHKLSEDLDGGDIIYQEEMFFDSSIETLESSYNKLNDRIKDLFKRHFTDIIGRNYCCKKQEGKGTYHNLKDLKKLQSDIEFKWDDIIDEVLYKYTRKCMENS